MDLLEVGKGKGSGKIESTTFLETTPVKLQTNGSYFYKIMVNPSAQSHKLRIPEDYVKKYEDQWAKDHVTLRVPDGRVWRVEFSKESGKVWLNQGWDVFVISYSLSYGNFLLFKYDEVNFEFHVTIFDMTGCEIEYDQMFNSRIKAQEVATNSSEDEEMDHQHNDDIVSPENENGVAIPEKTSVIRSLETFKSQSPHFKLVMHRSHVSHGYRLSIPMKHVKAHLNPIDEHGIILLEGPDDKSYNVRLTVYTCSNQAQAITVGYGWQNFVTDYELNVGDGCVFELIDQRSKTYKVTIFRARDQLK